jgi:hypothetical protein
MTLKTIALAACLAGLATTPGQESANRPEPEGPRVGKPAPRLRLNDETGKAVSVGGESAQWTVLAFFPKAATPG